MEEAQTITILDVVYDVLSRSPEPLTPEQIAEAAREDGYDLDSWDVRLEIDSHLQAYGHRSPFTEIGQIQYSLLPLPVQWESPPLSLSILNPLTATVVLLISLLLAFLVVGWEKPIVQIEVASNPAPPPAEVEQARAAPGDPGWWSTNGQNQINPKAFEVAQQYLRNAYNTCGPAVIAMLASYYREHNQGEGGRVTTARVLRDAREKLGFYAPPYNSGLLEFSHLREMARLYGLVQVSGGGESSLMSLDDLLAGLRQGNPAIAGMRYHYVEGKRYQPAGGRGLYNHFVVVFHVTQEDGEERLWVLNPHPGKYLTSNDDVAPEALSLAQFSESWMLNNGTEYADYGHAAFYEYRP